MKLLLLILLITTTAVVAQESSHHQAQVFQLAQDVHRKGAVLIHTHVDADSNIKYYAISTSRLADSPTWDGNDKAPLELNKAIAVAREYLSKQHPKRDSLPLSSASLFTIDNKSYSNRWYYALKFRIATKSTQKIDRTELLGLITVGNQELDLPKTIEMKRTKYAYPQVYVMLDGHLIEERTKSANKTNGE